MAAEPSSGDELVVLIRGEDSGHAVNKDPFVRAHVVICGAAGRTSVEREPWCGRLEVGAWLDEARAGATEAQRRASWSGTLHIRAGGDLELVASAPQRSRSLDLHGLQRADLRLVPF